MQKLYAIVGILILSFLWGKSSKAATLPEEGGPLKTSSFRKLSPSELQWIYRDAHCHPFYPKYTEKQRAMLIHSGEASSELGRIRDFLEREKLPSRDSKIESSFWEKGTLPEEYNKDNYAIILFSEEDVKRTGESMGGNINYRC